MRLHTEINELLPDELERLVLNRLEVSEEAYNAYCNCSTYHAQRFASKLYDRYKTDDSLNYIPDFAEQCVWYAVDAFDGVKEGTFADWVMGNLLVLRFNRTFDGVSIDDVDERVSAIRAVAKTCGGLEWKLS